MKQSSEGHSKNYKISWKSADKFFHNIAYRQTDRQTNQHDENITTAIQKVNKMMKIKLKRKYNKLLIAYLWDMGCHMIFEILIHDLRLTVLYVLSCYT